MNHCCCGKTVSITDLSVCVCTCVHVCSHRLGHLYVHVSFADQAHNTHVPYCDAICGLWLHIFQQSHKWHDFQNKKSLNIKMCSHRDVARFNCSGTSHCVTQLVVPDISEDLQPLKMHTLPPFETTRTTHVTIQ